MLTNLVHFFFFFIRSIIIKHIKMQFEDIVTKTGLFYEGKIHFDENEKIPP